jgi:hypothetical protein
MGEKSPNLVTLLLMDHELNTTRIFGGSFKQSLIA